MKYISLDIETTDIRPENGQILSIGVVVADTEGKVYEDLHIKLVPYKGKIKGNIFAINMNKDLIEDLKLASQGKPGEGYYAYEEDVTWQYLEMFLDKHFGDNPVPVAGKNVGTFDIPWLQHHSNGHFKSFSRRYLDVGPLFVEHGDTELPNLQECMKRAGVEGNVTHDALKDAYDVVSCITNYFNTKDTFNKAIPDVL